MAPSLTDQIKGRARDLGFDLVGIAPAGPPAHWAFYRRWVEKGYAGEMAYLGRNTERRADVRAVAPGAESVLCVGMNYPPGEVGVPDDGRPRGRVSRYALGEDYHDLMVARLLRLLEEIRGLAPSAEGRVYVDTGPVLERDFASRAGVGWFGKHTNLIHKGMGSWFFLGEIILTIALDYDAPAGNHCGTCTRCIDACPTGAIRAPYTLDSRRCISYLTIELKGSIPRELRPQMGAWVYGCDVCQEVCPWNRKHAQPTREPGFGPREDTASPDLAELLKMDQATFSRRYRGSPVKRAKRRGLLRNAAVALGNVGSERDVTALAVALDDSEALVRGHAAWALGQIGGEAARRALVAGTARETDADVLCEMQLALSDCCGKDG